MTNRETESTAEQLDNAFESALKMPAESAFQSLCRAVEVSNVLYWYHQCGIFYPPMDAVKRSVFEQCIAKKME